MSNFLHIFSSVVNGTQCNHNSLSECIYFLPTIVQYELALNASLRTNLPPHSSAIQRTVSSARETRTFPSTDAPRCTSVVWCPRSVHPLQAKCKHFNFYFTTTQLQPKRNVAKTASPWFPFFCTYKIPRFFQYFFPFSSIFFTVLFFNLKLDRF